MYYTKGSQKVVQVTLQTKLQIKTWHRDVSATRCLDQSNRANQILRTVYLATPKNAQSRYISRSFVLLRTYGHQVLQIVTISRLKSNISMALLSFWFMTVFPAITIARSVHRPSSFSFFSTSEDRDATSEDRDATVFVLFVGHSSTVGVTKRTYVSPRSRTLRTITLRDVVPKTGDRCY